MLPASADPIPADLLARDYGDDFSTSLIALPLGTWRGPVASAYGVHLVRVTSRTPGRPATLAEVRTAVERDWENDRRLLGNEDYFHRMRQKYEVVMEATLPRMPETGARN